MKNKTTIALLAGLVAILVIGVVILVFSMTPDKGTTSASVSSRTQTALDPPSSNNAGESPSSQTSGERTITGAQAREIYEQNDGVILLDIRPERFQDGYFIEGSKVISATELESRLGELPQDRNATIIYFCSAGMLNGMAYEILSDAGYTDLYGMTSIMDWPLPLVEELK